jgi:hypothetical protein
MELHSSTAGGVEIQESTGRTNCLAFTKGKDMGGTAKLTFSVIKSEIENQQKENHRIRKFLNTTSQTTSDE